jgi:preprotein translocase subunit SecA
VGGLRIVGTERHESRRIDNQLRGRAGRQGDIGSSVFYLSMEDDLLKIFGGSRMQWIAQKFSIDEDTPFSFGILTRQVESAQRSIEGRHYSARKQVLEYDNVMNAQRTTVYEERNRVLRGEPVHDQILTMIKDEISLVVDNYTDPKTDWPEWEVDSLNTEIKRLFLPKDDGVFLTEDRLKDWDIDAIKEKIYDAVMVTYTEVLRQAKELEFEFEEKIERTILLNVVDRKWMDHIDMMDGLRRGIGLKSYGQQDPVIAYKREGTQMFDDMIRGIQEEVVFIVTRIEGVTAVKREGQDITQAQFLRSDGKPSKAKRKPVVNTRKKIGRNDPCPCGSGKRYKDCCLDKDNAE